MPRIAGDNPGYTFRLCRNVDGLAIPTKHGFDLPSVSTIIKEVMGVPAGAMSWYGFRIGLKGIADVISRDDMDLLGDMLSSRDAEELEAFLKTQKVNPNLSLEKASDRGNNAHFILEILADGVSALQDPDNPVTHRMLAEAYAYDEAYCMGTLYGDAVIAWWDEKIQPYIHDGTIIQVLSEVPVWSLKYQTVGTFDLAIEWGWDAADEEQTPRGWEVLDLKTHKPARGYTKEGSGPAYISDVLQIRTYRELFEEMGYGKTFAQRVVIARDNGKVLEDAREVPFRLFVALREAYDHKQRFEKGAA